MVATQTQLRRGTSAQCEAATPAEGEPWVDMTLDTLRIGDGLRQGGFILPNFNQVQTQAFQFAVAGGSANALTLTLNPAPLSYSQPLKIVFKVGTTNSGSATINVNGLGVRTLQKISESGLSNLEAGDLITGAIYEAVYNGSTFQIISGSGGSGGGGVSQGDLNTSVGTVTLTSEVTASQTYTLPGGKYGFYPNVRCTGSDVTGSVSFASVLSSTFQPRIGLVVSTSQSRRGYVYAEQTYITSSPPYDLGDGEVGGFVFLLINEAAEIQSSYIADAPPWAYNGPTDIRCTHKCPISGKKYKRVLKKRSFAEVMDGGKIEYEMQEITHDIKNADMGLIPHPFGDIPAGQRVVLLDPMSDKIRRMIEMNNAGYSDDVADFVQRSIKIENDHLSRKCPKSVTPCKFRFKKHG